MSTSIQTDTRTRILEAALKLVTMRQGTDLKMGDVAKTAQLSRQAVYLHFVDRAELLLAMVRHFDEKRDLAGKIHALETAPTGVDAIKGMVALQASDNPLLWPVARLWHAARHSDPAVERSWQDRLQHRLQGCLQLVTRLHREGRLKQNLPPRLAADLLWTLTSLRMWEDLVIERGWSAAKYERHLLELISNALLTQDR